MLPDHVLSTEFFPTQFRYPRNIPKRLGIAYEYGGIALDDASEGLRRRVWKGEYIDGSVVLSAEGVSPVSVLTVADISDFDFTFDQNMRVAVAYELLSGGGSFFYWYDSTISGYTTLELGSAATPKCAIDDNRDTQTAVSDIILAYIRDGNLYFREQRDRYTVERLLQEQVGERLVQIGMNDLWRFQFQIHPTW